MAAVEILHRLFTNAAEGLAGESPSGRGIRLAERDIANANVPDVLIAVDDLLRKSTAAAHETAYVVRRFKGGDGALYGCVIVSYPDVFEDAQKRPGFLNHARLMCVGEPSLDALALFEAAQGFPTDIYAAPYTERLNLYLDFVRGDASALLLPVTMRELQEISREVLHDFLLAVLASIGRRERLLVAMPTADPRTLSTAWAAVPLALQLTSSWGIGVGESCPVDVVFSSQGAPAAKGASPALADLVERYVALLQAAPDTARSILRNPSLSTLTALDEAVRRAAIAAPLSSSSTSRKEEMSKKEKTTHSDPRREREEWQPLPSDVVTEMNRQYQKLEALLLSEMDERLAAWEGRERPQVAGRLRPRTTTMLLPSWLRLWLPLAVAAIAVIAMIWYGLWREPSRLREPERAARPEARGETAQEEQDPEPSPTPRPPTAADRAVANGEATGGWAVELKALLASDPDLAVRSVERAAAIATGNARAQLETFADRIARREELSAEGPQGREGLRALLLQCIAAEAAPDANVKIDTNLADVTPLLDVLQQRYKVSSTLRDVSKMELQSEIILRWMASPDR